MCVQEAELQRLAKAREQELSYKQQMDGLEVEKQKRLAQIESERFSQLVQSLGSDTLKEMARAGPETQVTSLSVVVFSVHQVTSLQPIRLHFLLQVKMLQALGLKSTLITDGSSPINLFTTASGLLGALPGQ